ncbi:MAG TPA: hypothetical protein PKN32_13085 [Bacteroidales bacterium]|nr:hypothetical protein [Bacteroidales bacterium]
MHFVKVAILFFCLIISNFNLSSQSDEDYKEFLYNNVKSYDESVGLMPDTDYSKYRLFVVGEIHFYKENSKIFLNIFRNLYKNANVRVILLESGYATGIIAQHYLETGDNKSLKIISEDGQFDEFHYRFLKDFYDKCPKDDKFKIIGIDLENYSLYNSFIYAVRLLFRDTVMPETLDELLGDFETLIDSEDYDVIVEEYDKIYLDYRYNKTKYKDLLFDNYIEYEELMERMRKSLKFGFYNYNFGKDSVEHSRRENYIFRSIVKEIKRHPDCNYFGQFGLAHIGLSRFLITNENNIIESFVTHLNNSEYSPVKDSVCSSLVLYFDEYYGDNNKLVFFYDEFMYSLSTKKYLPPKVYKILKNYKLDKGFYFVNLAQDDSPFAEFAKRNYQFLILKK